MGDYFDLVADRFGLARPPRLARDDAAAVLSPMQMSFLGESRRLVNARLKQELRLRAALPDRRRRAWAPAPGATRESTIDRDEGPAATQPMPAAVFIDGDPRPRARARAGRVPLGAERRRARRRRRRPRLADAAPACRRACRASAGSARSRPGSRSCSRPTSRRTFASRASSTASRPRGSPSSSSRWRCAMRARSSATRRSSAQRDWTRRPLPIARHRVARARHRRDGRRDRAPGSSAAASSFAAGTGARRSRSRRCSAQSEIVVCALAADRPRPKASSTRARSRAMPRGAYVINVARGAHIVEPDLIAAVRSGHLERRGARRAAAASRCRPTIRSGRCPASRSRRTSPRSRRPETIADQFVASAARPAARRADAERNRPRARLLKAAHGPPLPLGGRERSGEGASCRPAGRPRPRHTPCGRLNVFIRSTAVHRQAAASRRRAGSRGRRRARRAVAAPERAVDRGQVGDRGRRRRRR